MRTDINSTLRTQLRTSAATTARTGEPDREVVAELRASGLLGIGVPVEYGGTGGTAADVNRVVEEIASVNASLAIIAFQHFAVCARITEWGTPEQRARLLPALADGTWLAASAWSEPGAGAAKRHLSSTGVRRHDGSWQLDGAKSFTTGAGLADLYLVLVRTGPAPTDSGGYGATGQTFFLVTADNPGIRPRLGLDLIGMRGSATGLVGLERCAVPDADRLGATDGAQQVIAQVRESGATLGAVSVGIAQAALDIAVCHANRHDLLTVPMFRHRLTELATHLESARALVDRAGARTAPNPGLTTLYSKLYASSAAEEICLDVARLLGSAGYQAGEGLTRLLADARGVALMGPTNDLCRELAAASWEH
ncbi:acyl-CoA dehydrogenase [Streptomyces sp. YC537]|uniref:Acyl-CoA dehydrogenase n=2 Tax=Streptomyces boluensis TaxID=1775135 RepID=A0A964UIV3_9ACTN|nr:acyl-CoA dehydrogenase [Streptomyces boluensis]